MNKYLINSIGIWADSDRFIKEVLIDGEYKFLFNYDTVVDLGCNVGTFSLWIYPYAQKIYAIEPNPKAINLFRKTIEDNKLDKITLVEAAVMGSDGNRFLKDADDEHKQYGAGLINDKEGIMVKGIQLNTFMAEYKIDYIDLLKVDIERSEKELFESEGFRNVAFKIGTIIGEYHTGDIKSSISSNLSSMGFKFTDITGGNASGKFIARRL